MTDLPQLQTQLVGAAVRRRRRRRARHLTMAVALLAALPLLAREVAAPDPEVTAPTPTPTPAYEAPQTVEAAFGVFRRAPQSTREQIAEHAGTRVFLERRDGDLCLSTTRRSSSTMGCGPERTYLSGHRLLMDFGKPLLAAAFPDGVREATVTFPGAAPRVVPVRDNGLATALQTRSARVEWIAPDGTARTETFYGAMSAETHWARFWDVETPLDRLDRLPGARRLITKEDVAAWLVPRRNAICLVVAAGNARRSACRRTLGDVPFPIVVSVGPTIVAAFPDGLHPDGVRPLKVRHTGQADALIIFDGDAATALHYRDRTGHRELRLPEQTNFVLHAEPMNPRSLKP